MVYLLGVQHDLIIHSEMITTVNLMNISHNEDISYLFLCCEIQC